MKFKEYNLEGFLEDLASSSPAPGGGSTAALVGALAGALNSMVYSLTVGKKSFEELTEENKNKMMRLHESTKRFIDQSMIFMEKDREEFNSLMASFKLPKETEEEKKIRSLEIKNRTISAMHAPYDFAVDALAFYRNIEFAVEYGNKNLISDAGVAAILLHAAIESAIINVKINYVSIKQESEAKDILNLCSEIYEKSSAYKQEITKKVEKAILG
ncbi:MAG: cyclodeaminase/cyclohydrolase family protein [Clostridium sp.]